MSGTSEAPRFTVLMATYRGDDPALFRRAIDSVYANSRQPDDFVLVVDGPVPDALADEIAARQDAYGLNVLKLPVNVGLSAALNQGLERVRTEWTARADSDDINLADRFERQLRFLAEQGGELDLFGCAIQEVDEQGRPGGIRRPPSRFAEIRRFAQTRNPLNHMTAFFRTDLIRSYGGYPSVYLREDYALWINLIADRARVANMPDVLVHARAGHGMIKRRGGLQYARGEIELQRLLIDKRMKHPVRAIVDGALRAAVFLAPDPFRNAIYARLLRS